MVDPSQERESTRRVLGEAAMLSPIDPQWHEAQQLLANADDWAQREWQLLMEETDLLRRQVPRALGETDVPVELEQRLLEISDVAALPARTSSRWGRHGGWLIAVTAVIFVVAGFILTRVARQNSHLETLAVLAIHNHVNHVDDEESFQAIPVVDLKRQLTAQLEFDVRIPKLGPALELAGGRKCKLGTRPVAYTLWQGPKGKASLFQFRPEEFGLPEEMAPTLVDIRGTAVADGPGAVLVWTRASRGYALVGVQPSDVDPSRAPQETKKYEARNPREGENS